ncbi:MAG: MBL fold metallo-hydrolase [Anaerolineae bacterium]|nr:MBL fold metallo-hydrolase [Anaerolineae bacterium]
MEEIVAGLWRIPLAAGSVNVYLWQGGDGLTLVDCGYAGSGQHILRLLSQAGHTAQDVRCIVITHGDFDHVGGLATLRAATGAAVLAHSQEVAFIEGQRRRPWGPTPAGQLLAWADRLLTSAGLSRIEAACVDRPLTDGEVLDGGWQVVHTPGHTPGHIALYHPHWQVLIAGDLLSQRRGRPLGPVPAYAVDMRQAAASVRRLAALEPRILCFGHRRPLTVGQPQALYDLARQLEERYGSDSRP